MLTVVQKRRVPAAPGRTWSYLSEARLVGEWFADVGRLAPGGPFRFEFGDGDFFAGRIVGWQPPERLALTWRFMGVGTEYDVEYRLRPEGDGTELAVRDHGALTQEEADGLSEGWDDFLARLEHRIRTGRPARYRWTPSIGAGAVVPAARADVVSLLSDPAWWRRSFPEARCRVEAPEDGEVTARVSESGWGHRATQARLGLRAFGEAVFVSVSHVGWDAFPEDRQVQERRRYAGRWARALEGLEGWRPAPAGP